MLVVSMLLVLAGSVTVPPAEPLTVIGGDVAQACEWPSTVLMSGCSGTLVHPEIVMYAAHCPNTTTVRFGTNGGERTAATTVCRRAPEYPATGFDYSYCRLAQPVTDVPIVPVMMGCERQQLPVGKRAWMVGFGNTSNQGGGFGTKRWIEGDVAGFPSNGRLVGIFYDEGDIGICNGDSGGSAYTQLDDGTWRLFGIASTVPGACGGSSQHVPAWAAVPWIEADSGIDITPCHDADGAWNPGPDCDRFPTAPGNENGLSWASGCGPGPVGEVSSTCGPSVGESPDELAPVVTIVSPVAGGYPGPDLETAIEIDVSDNTGILDVSVRFADEEQALFETQPYEIPSVVFPEGSWEILVSARDWSGNITQSSVTIEVGVAAEASGGETDDSGDSLGTEGTTGSSMSEGTGSGAETDAGSEVDRNEPGAGGSDGGGCSAARFRAAVPGFLVLLVAMYRRRRRRSADSGQSV